MPSYLDGTLFSIILCVLAGIALRYALHYGKEALLEQKSPPVGGGAPAGESMERTRVLHDALEREQSEHVRLRRDVERLQEEYFHAHRHNQELQEELRKHEQAQARHEEHLDAVTRELEEQRRLVQNERLHSGDLLSQLKASTETLDQVRQQDLTMADLVENLQRTAAARDELARRLEATEANRAQIREEAEELRGGLAGLHDEMARLSADVRFAEEVRAQNQALQQLLQDAKDQSRRLQDDRDELRGKFELVAQAMEGLRGDGLRWKSRAEQLHIEVDQLNRQIDDYAQRERQWDRLRQEMDERSQSATLQLQALGEQQRKWLLDGQEQLETMDRDHQNEMRVMRQQLLAELEDKQQALEDLRGETGRRMEEHQLLLVELDRLRDVDATLAERERQLQVALQEREAARRGVEEATERVEQLENQLRDTDGKVGFLATEKDELVLGLQREKEARLAVQAALNALQDRLRLLETDSIELASTRSRTQTVEKELQTLRSEASMLATERDEMKMALARAERRNETLEAELLRVQGDLGRRDSSARQLRIEKEEALTHLERERNERGLLERKLRLHAQTIEKLTTDSRSLESLLERQRVLQTSLVAHTQRLSANSDGEIREAAGSRDDVAESSDVLAFQADRRTPREDFEDLVKDPARGWIYRRAPRRTDNLKLIAGIGDVIEAQLHELGIYTFEQIMQWDATAVQAISKELAFKDRIDREQWVKQAARFHREETRKAA